MQEVKQCMPGEVLMSCETGADGVKIDLRPFLCVCTHVRRVKILLIWSNCVLKEGYRAGLILVVFSYFN